jgi:hypothetical protein
LKSAEKKKQMEMEKIKEKIANQVNQMKEQEA